MATSSVAFPRRPGTWITLVMAAGVGLFAWLFRFNDPNGSFAGLTDDHFFYLVRGWQLLFGDLPVRDFVDHGAPLFYYVGAAVQVLFGSGTLPELAFTATVLAACASMTFWQAMTASGSRVGGLIGVAFHVLLSPRFYNYPKILVYVVALPLLWRFADRRTTMNRFWLALVTAVGFLFRHDHGAFVAAAVGTLLLCSSEISWRDKLRHGALYAVMSLALLSPYLLFVQLNGGVQSYLAQAQAWAERDRARAPVVWPGLFDNPDGVSDVARTGQGLSRAVASVRDNAVAWTFYLEIVLPLLALVLLLASRAGLRPDWPRARTKLLVVAVLAWLLDAGFLRSPLGARLADPSVPLAVLLAWLVVALPRALSTPTWLAPSVARHVWPIRAVAVVLAAPIAFVLGSTMSDKIYDRLDSAAISERPGRPFERVGTVAAQLRSDWRLESWLDRADRPALVDLSLYVNACTMPTDRVLVQAYMPQVLALARRAFAGGHGDLRPGFFGTEEAQRLTVARLEAQSVPIVLLEADESYENFRKAFPLIVAHLDAHYRVVGVHAFERFRTTLLVRRDRVPQSTYAPLDWPCFGTGRVQS